MTIIELLNGDSRRADQGSDRPPNSTAIPLPTAFWDPEFRCRPFVQLIIKWLIYRMFLTWRERFWGLWRDSSLMSGTSGTEAATAGPRYASGLPVGAQAVDEVGKAELPLAPQPLGGDDRLNLRDALLDLAVDDHVIIFRPVAGLLGRLCHSSRDDGCAVLGAVAQAGFKLGAARGQHEDRNEIAPHCLGQLLGSLPVEIADHVATGSKRLIDPLPRRPVAVSEHGRMLQEPASSDHFIEAALVDKHVVATLDLAFSLRPCRHRDR